MATNTNNGSRKGAVKGRTQTFNPANGLYVKRDAQTGKFMSTKKDGKPYKGISKEEIAKLAPVLKKLADYDKR